MPILGEVDVLSEDDSSGSGNIVEMAASTAVKSADTIVIPTAGSLGRKQPGHRTTPLIQEVDNNGIAPSEGQGKRKHDGQCTASSNAVGEECVESEDKNEKGLHHTVPKKGRTRKQNA
jgi:hypothetical protein